jgi:hypothetical protein
MGHVGRDAGVLEQVGQPDIAEGGFEGDFHGLRFQLTEDGEELIRPARNPSCECSSPPASSAAICETLR